MLLLFAQTGAQTWNGSTAVIGFSALSGAWQAPGTWVGSIARVGVAGISGAFTTGQTWAGSTARIGVSARSGAWAGTPVEAGRAGVTVIGRGRTRIAAHAARTAMMVGTGRSRVGD